MKPSSNSILLLLGEILAGALTGLAVAYLAGRMIGAFGSSGATGFDDLIGVLTALLIAYPIGVAVGNFLFNRRFRSAASFWLALSGSVGGVILVILLAEPLNLNVESAVLMGALGVVPPVLAAIAVRIRLGKQ